MSRVNPPYRADIVGSFLRPAAVKEARAQFAAGTLSREALTAVENDAIRDLVTKEKTAGLVAVTDGEFRRHMWHLDFLAELTGLRHVKAICCVRCTDYTPIDRYRDNEALLMDDIAQCWIDAMLAFYARGCRYLQLDDTSWGEFCSAEKRAAYAARGIDVDRVGRLYVACLNKILAAKPADMTVTMHICRGNFRSTWFSSGGYEPVAEILFAHCNVDGFFLEYDSDRAGGFEPLRFIKDQTVVLGLVTSKFPELEKKAAVKARIAEAAKYVPLNQLALSPQCGFSSTEEGNVLTEEDQWAKIRLIVEIAREVWPDAL